MYSSSTGVLVLWTVVHLALGATMLVYCIARRLFGKMDAKHDADIVNVTLGWHFLLLTVAITGSVLALFPWVA